MADVVRRRRRNLLRRNRVFRDRIHPFDKYDDVDLYKKFRFRREDIIHITDDVTDALELANRTGVMSPILQVLLTLRFYATGSFQDVCGELVGVSQCTAGRTITRVTTALLQTVHNWIVFPDRQEAENQKRKFADMAGFPNVFACIDGTHIEIQRPWDNERHPEYQYVNRKNYHSINVQVICNADLIFIDVVANWPGSVHDARILRQSGVFQAFEGHPKPINGLMLGDSGYMLRDWLMTPYPNPGNIQEQNFNNSHKSTRSTVERAIGVAKRRWRCLKGLRVEPDKASNIINVCLMLHNRARLLRLPLPDNDNDSDSDSDDEDAEIEGDGEAHNANLGERLRQARGRQVRNNIVEQYF